MSPIVFEGNWPVSVSRDAKFSVRSEKGVHVIGILYETREGEKWYPTNSHHEDLVKMVNKIKTEISATPGGAFYLNEYRQVIVPAGDPLTYFYAGDYEKDLIFDFEGKKLCGLPADLEGNPLKPGDTWVGPHAGIPYTLKAGARDIYYTKQVRPNVTKDELLSKHVGPVEARKTASKVASIKGSAGGRFYINECRSIFAPLDRGATWEYIYIGRLEDDDPWFPRPHRTGW
jgi:hypothetical protein